MTSDPIDPDGFKKADETLKSGYMGEYKEVCPWCEGHPPCEYEMGYAEGRKKGRGEGASAVIQALKEATERVISKL